VRTASSAAVLAVDLGGTKLAVALVDRDGKISARGVEPVVVSSPSAPIDQIVALVEQVAGAGERGRRPGAIGIAVPGLVRRSGTVWAPNLTGWDRMPLAKRLEKRLGVRVAVESDRNAAVLGEVWRGAARGRSDAIVLIVGTGIGAGILSGGALVRGAHELSGCAGWLVVSDDDNEMTGRCGQLESLAAGPALARQARQVMKSAGARANGVEIMTAHLIAEAARRGDRACRAIFRRSGELLGRGVANLISLFDPEVIVLGGGLAGAADLYLETLETAARAYAQPLAARQVRITVSRLGNDANLLGAARLAWDSVGFGPEAH
jgi:glucokinase